MTQKKLQSFNNKINILYDRECLKLTIDQLVKKYQISQQMISVHLKLARNNHRIIEAVLKRAVNEREKENKSYE